MSSKTIHLCPGNLKENLLTKSKSDIKEEMDDYRRYKYVVVHEINSW